RFAFVEEVLDVPDAEHPRAGAPRFRGALVGPGLRSGRPIRPGLPGPAAGRTAGEAGRGRPAPGRAPPRAPRTPPGPPAPPPHTPGPVRPKDLRGKVVVLDFWTLCCINCIHTLPDLARLEKKYPNELVVVGVHSAKFDNEKGTDSIRKAILRYEISHPVVNDANMRIWRAYGVRSWPTLFVIDPEGNAAWAAAGEGLYDRADAVISKLIKIHSGKKTLDEQPLSFKLARLRERGDTPLFFPGKILADAAGQRLFIADSTH